MRACLRPRRKSQGTGGLFFVSFVSFVVSSAARIAVTEVAEQVAVAGGDVAPGDERVRVLYAPTAGLWLRPLRPGKVCTPLSPPTPVVNV